MVVSSKLVAHECLPVDLTIRWRKRPGFWVPGEAYKSIFQVQYHIPLVIGVQRAQKSIGVWYCGMHVHHPLVNLSQILHWPVVIGAQLSDWEKGGIPVQLAWALRCPEPTARICEGEYPFVPLVASDIA